MFWARYLTEVTQRQFQAKFTGPLRAALAPAQDHTPARCAGAERPVSSFQRAGRCSTSCASSSASTSTAADAQHFAGHPLHPTVSTRLKQYSTFALERTSRAPWCCPLYTAQPGHCTLELFTIPALLRHRTRTGPLPPPQPAACRRAALQPAACTSTCIRQGRSTCCASPRTVPPLQSGTRARGPAVFSSADASSVAVQLLAVKAAPQNLKPHYIARTLGGWLTFKPVAATQHDQQPGAAAGVAAPAAAAATPPTTASSVDAAGQRGQHPSLPHRLRPPTLLSSNSLSNSG